MPAKDLYHEIVVEALQKEGWTITHDPYFLQMGKRKGFIDIGAEMIPNKQMKKILFTLFLCGSFGGISKAQDTQNKDILVLFNKFSTNLEISKNIEQVRKKGGNLEITHCQRKRNGKIRSLAGMIKFPNGCSGIFKGKRILLKTNGLATTIKTS